MHADDRPRVPCGICSTPTPMTGTKRCDRCWELERRIHADRELAAKILGVQQLQRDADAFHKLQRILGYVENSSEQIVTLSHDDATRTVHLTVKGYLRDSKERNYHGTSLIGAIQAAIDAGEGEE